jgi:hypothetical protein
LLVAAIPAAGIYSSVPATILKSVCSSRSTPMTWRGGENHWNTSDLPHGTVVVCYTKYRLQDQDATGDYYAIEVSSEYTLSAATVYPSDPAVASQYAISDTASKDDRYGWTRAYTSSRSCTSPFTVGLNVAIFSISTTPEACSSYSVYVLNPGTRGATWQTTYAGEMRDIETTFVQKVPNGVVPTYSIQFRIPYYIYRYDANFSGYWVTQDSIFKTYTGV